METEKSGQGSTALSPKAGKQIVLKQVTREEWAAVPRTIPNFWVAAGTWIPMGIILFLIHDQLIALALVADGLWGLVSLSTIAFAIALIFGSGRQAPWLGLGITGIIYYFQPHHSTIQTFMMVALGYYGLLSILVAASDARFKSLLRSWRREATGSLTLASAERRCFGVTKYMSPVAWNLALGALAYPAVRLAWEYFSTETSSLSDLDAGFRFDLLAAMALLAVCFLLSILRWIGSRSVGIFALEIPVDAQIGPTPLRVLGQAILIEQETWKCGCRDSEKNESKKPFVDPRFIFASDFCQVHGIEAVNKLSHSEFLQIAQQPWVYGRNLTGKILYGTRQRMNIVGLTGWGSRPVAVRSPWLYGGGEQASDYYAPLAAREPLNRSKRVLKVIDPADNTLAAESLQENTREEIDRISLRSVGIDAEAVRVQGARPFLA